MMNFTTTSLQWGGFIIRFLPCCARPVLARKKWDCVSALRPVRGGCGKSSMPPASATFGVPPKHRLIWYTRRDHKLHEQTKLIVESLSNNLWRGVGLRPGGWRLLEEV